MKRHPWMAFLLCTGAMAPAVAQGGEAVPLPRSPDGRSPDNRYNLQPFHADFPVQLEWPNSHGLEYDRTRRQILSRLAQNLQGNVRREAWQLATEFFWRAPDDAVEPLIETMDRAFGNPALLDVVRNCIEAMGKMRNPRLDSALRRAAEHDNEAVRQAAYLALATSGTEETLRAMRSRFDKLDGRARTAWMKQVRIRLPADREKIFRELMAAEYPQTVRDELLKEVLQLPAAEAAPILRVRWLDARGEWKATIAGVLHASSDVAGTTWIRETLQGTDIAAIRFAVRHCTFGDLGELRADVLRLSTHPRPEVRLELARALAKVGGDDVADVYETLAIPDEVEEVKLIALSQLTRRGRGATVAGLIEDARTATGTRLQLLLAQLAASGDPMAIAVLLERFRRAPVGEGRPFLQALAHNGGPAAATALLELFRGPEVTVGRTANGNLTTWNYVPVLLPNLRGAEQQILDEYAAIAREDWRRRALMLPALSGIAADRADPGVQQRCIDVVRGVLFDKDELPQLRVLALNLLTVRWLTVEDVLALKKRRHDEQPGLKALFADFLNDFF